MKTYPKIKYVEQLIMLMKENKVQIVEIEGIKLIRDYDMPETEQKEDKSLGKDTENMTEDEILFGNWEGGE